MKNELLSIEKKTKKAAKINSYNGKSVTETINNGFFTVDQQWTIKYWNKAAEKLLGLPASSVVGKNLWDECMSVIPLEFYTVSYSAFQADAPPEFEEYWEEMGTWFDVIAYHSKETLSVSFKSRIQPERSGTPSQQLKILYDLYRFMTEVTSDCLWEWNLLTKQIFWIDGGHKRAFGYQIQNAFVPQVFWEGLLHPDDKVRVLTRLSKILDEGTSSFWEDEYRLKKANGKYVYVHERGHIIYDNKKAALRIIGATRDITTRKTAEIKLLASEKALVQERLTKQKEITQAVLSTQENERLEIGRELHDNLNQILGAAKLYIELAKTDEEYRGMCLDKSSVLIVNVIEEIRKISKSLATPAMNMMGLLDSIRILIDDLIVVHPIKIGFNAKGITDDDLDEKMQLDIFRIVQEQLNNILKHANATRANIALTRFENNITLVISDNGIGDQPSKENKGIGLMNIKHRAELYHGNVTVTSNPGEGYELKVELTLNEPSPDLLR